MSVAFTDNTATNWVNLRFERCYALPGIRPRLVIAYEARLPDETFKVDVDYLKAAVFVAEQFVGTGFIPGRSISRHGTTLEVEVPVSLRDLNLMHGHLTSDAIGIQIEFEGLMRVWHDSDHVAGFAGSPTRGEWTALPVGTSRQARDSFQVARSDWVTRVMQAAGAGEYILSELRIPLDQLRGPWRLAAEGLKAAETQFFLGNDPEVFFRARAAFEALPGHPKEIFSFLQDEEKGKRLDDVFRAVVSYLHHGRHIATAQGGERVFPVTHADAEFALNLSKLLLAHLASLSS